MTIDQLTPGARRLISLSADFPKIITLCGSTRFAEQYIRVTREETLKGNIVISVGMFGHQEGIDMEGEVKQNLDKLHLRKIDLCDEVFVINPKVRVCGACGKPCPVLTSPFGLSSECCSASFTSAPYIGSSTRNEINYALSRGKPARYLEES